LTVLTDTRLCGWCETALPQDWGTSRRHISDCLDSRRAESPQPVPSVRGLYRIAAAPGRAHVDDISLGQDPLGHVTPETLLRHARRYGAQGVLDAAERQFDWEALERVRDGLAGKQPRKTEEREQLVLRLLTERGRSSEEIAEQLSVRLTLVRRVIRLHRRRIVTELLGQGLMPAAIADRLGFSDSFVRTARQG
jgi:hypothetical protein